MLPYLHQPRCKIAGPACVSDTDCSVFENCTEQVCVSKGGAPLPLTHCNQLLPSTFNPSTLRSLRSTIQQVQLRYLLELFLTEWQHLMAGRDVYHVRFDQEAFTDGISDCNDAVPKQGSGQDTVCVLTCSRNIADAVGVWQGF